ncbi:protein eva-1 homolog A isoform X4 [Equus przewalskii]|uniref:Protein eva-1 homolog A isoform X4 n=1 Tax=Equus przewalskii TaxID=9798 RepID=A0ABM4KNT3_EQUPR
MLAAAWRSAFRSGLVLVGGKARAPGQGENSRRGTFRGPEDGRKRGEAGRSLGARTNLARREAQHAAAVQRLRGSARPPLSAAAGTPRRTPPRPRRLLHWDFSPRRQGQPNPRAPPCRVLLSVIGSGYPGSAPHAPSAAPGSARRRPRRRSTQPVGRKAGSSGNKSKNEDVVPVLKEFTAQISEVVPFQSLRSQLGPTKIQNLYCLIPTSSGMNFSYQILLCS